MTNKYEISAELTIHNKNAKKVLNDTVDKIKELNGETEKYNKVQKDNKKVIEGTLPSFNKLTSGLNHQNKVSSGVIANLRDLHNELTTSGAKYDEYAKKMTNFANKNGLIFKRGIIRDSIKDITLETKILGKETENVMKGIEHFSKKFHENRDMLHMGDTDIEAFHKTLRDIGREVNRLYGVKVTDSNGIFNFKDINYAEQEKQAKKLTQLNQKVANTYKPQFEMVISGLNKESLARKELIKIIEEQHHKSMNLHHDEKQYNNEMRKIAKNNGLIFSSGVFSNNAYDRNIRSMKVLGEETTNTKKATEIFNRELEVGRSILRNGGKEANTFGKEMNRLRKCLKTDLGVDIRFDEGNYTIRDINREKELKELEKATKIKEKLYKSDLDLLTHNIDKSRKDYEDLYKNIKKTNAELVKNEANVTKANKVWREFGNNTGLKYSNGKLISFAKDTALSVKLIKNSAEDGRQSFNRLRQAKNEFESFWKDLQKTSHSGKLTEGLFNKKVLDEINRLSNQYQARFKQLHNGSYEIRSDINSGEKALNRYTSARSKSISVMRQGNFSPEDKNDLTKYRDRLGELLNFRKGYSQVLKETNNDPFKGMIYKLKHNTQNFGLHQSQVEKLENTYRQFRATMENTGGSLSMIANKTGNYNKLLTTTTRSQRLQNYAMQVGALKYNALGNMAGFVGGMFVTDLAMGFATARTEAVKYDQQAQQMLKTSKLNAREQRDLTKAVQDYTKVNKKVNTQGLEYAVTQVTKLSNLNVREAKKSIPVIADITNMMQLNGRTQEEAILAVNDALDGQFKRLQEIGVQGKQQLMDFGWTGKLNTSKDTLSLLEAIEKVSKQKGWHALTTDIRTLDDAYRVLGNTVDNILTPPMTKATPVVVDLTMGLAKMLTPLIEAPIHIQALAGAITVVLGSFSKMKLEMVKAKIFGSDFFARLTGLDDGMYGIKKSIGGVNSALKDNMLTFEEATRCVMDYHTQTIRANNTFRGYNNEITKINHAINELNDEQLFASHLRKNEINEEIALLKMEKEKIIGLRELDYGYAQYELAMRNLSVSEKRQLNNIMKMTGAKKSEIAHIIMANKLINGETGAIDLNTLATKMNVNALNKQGEVSSWVANKTRFQNNLTFLNNKYKQDSIRINKDLERSLYGLVLSEELFSKEAKKLRLEETLYNKVFSNNGIDINNRISKEQRLQICRGALNKVIGENTVIEGKNGLIINHNNELKKKSVSYAELEREVIDATNKSLALNTTERKFNNRGFSNYIGNLKKSAVGLGKHVGLILEEASAFMFATPHGLALSGALVGLGVVLNDLIQKQLSMNNKIKSYHDMLDNAQSKVNEYNTRLAKLKQGTKEYNEVLQAKLNYQADYKELEGYANYHQQVTDRIAQRRREMIQDLNSKYSQESGVKIPVSIELEGANLTYQIDKEIDKFTANFKEKRVPKLDLKLRITGASDKEIQDQVKKYIDHASEVVQGKLKQESPNLETRMKGYWDEFWGHYHMNQDENNGQHTQTIDLSKILNYDSEGLDQWFKNLRSNIDKFIQDNNLGWFFSSIMPTPVSANNGGKKPSFFEDLSNIGEWLSQSFANIGTTISQWSGQLWTDMSNLGHGLWTSFVNGLGNFGAWMGGILNGVWVTILKAPGQMWGTMWNFAHGLWTNFVNGLGDFGKEIGKMLDKTWHALLNAPQKIFDSAFSLGQKILNNFTRGLGNLGKMVGDDIENIKGTLKEGGKKIFPTAKMFGGTLTSGINSVWQHHSPGLIARWVQEDVEYINQFLKEGADTTGANAQLYGKSLTDNFNAGRVVNDNNEIMSSTNKAQIYTAQQYGTMTNTVNNAFDIMSENANQDMNQVVVDNANYLNRLNSDTVTGMSQIEDINSVRLKSMQLSTLNATNHMVKAWVDMKNNIVNCANQIRTQSYNKFESLHRTISSFYKQIQSAHFGSLSAGSPSGTTRSPVRPRMSAGSLSGSSFNGNFFDILPRIRALLGEELLIRLLKGLGGDSAGLDPNSVGRTHTNKIMSYAKNWGIKSPTFLGMRLNTNYKVNDFMNGTPNILQNGFENILTDICTQKGFRNPNSYEFYFNGQKSNQEVWDSVGCNCYDGAEMILAIAKMLGLNGSLIHGKWGSIGHVAAMINGKIFDMTQFQKRGVWRGTKGVNFAGGDTKHLKWGNNGHNAINNTNNSSNVVNVTISGNTFMGIDDYERQMNDIAENVFYDKLSINNCTGM